MANVHRRGSDSPMNSRTHPFTALALAIALSACSSSGGGKGSAVAAPPASFSGFPQQAVSGIVVAEAKLYTDHEAIFGDDLIDEDGVIPIALKIGLKGQGQEVSRVNLTSQGGDWRLYLQDGTALTSVPYEKVATGSKKVAERVTAHALKLTLLGKWDDAKEGFVFFKLAPPDAFSVDGATVTHRDGNSVRTIDLARSLVSFSVRAENEDANVNVGVQRDVQGAK